MSKPRPHAASFRDPSGVVFQQGNDIFRRVATLYQPHFDQADASGLFKRLIADGLMIPHKDVTAEWNDPTAYKVLQPEKIAFISYPYEWSFSQWQDAALLTLRIQKTALEHNMTLKDASAYNIQFHRGRPILIDTLSFETLEEGQPWGAYRQFCQHFLAPLALMSHRDIRLGQLARVHIDGIPLDLAAALLPRRTRFSLNLGMHLHLHARLQTRHAGNTDIRRTRTARLSRHQLLAIVDGLERTVANLKWTPAGTEWADYYQNTNYTDEAQQLKQTLVGAFLDAHPARTIWDFGANTGVFSRLAAARGANTMAFDIDPAAVELNYRQVRDKREPHMLPLLCDLANPAPSQGWAHQERDSLLARGPADLVMALALIHHLCIGNNVPFAALAAFLRACAPALIVEFVPREDSQVQRLLATRKDVFGWYTPESFEAAFGQEFHIVRKSAIPQTVRTLYLMEAKA